jgi:hypothetical protein
LPDHDSDAELGLVINELPARFDQIDLSVGEVGLVRHVLENILVYQPGIYHIHTTSRATHFIFSLLFSIYCFF